MTPWSSSRSIALEQAGRDGQRRVGRIASRGEGVLAPVGDDVDPRLRDVRGDRELADDVEQHRFACRVREPCAGRLEDDVRPEPVRPRGRPETDQGRDAAGPQGGHRVVGQGDRDHLRGRGDDPDQGDDEQDAVPPVRGRLDLERPTRRATAAERGDRERDDRQDRDGHDETPRQPVDRLAPGDEPPDGAHAGSRR